MDPRISAAIAVAAILILITLCYAAICYTMPFVRCRPCAGIGHRRRRIGRGTRPCKPCKATGRRLRAGRHLWNFLRTTIYGSTR